MRRHGRGMFRVYGSRKPFACMGDVERARIISIHGMAINYPMALVTSHYF